ncbi:MAG: cytochrome c-type biogenesis protein [Solirubrobacteraceae bacterium]
MRALIALVLLLGLTGAAPQTTLPDVEDEVMCVECGTALNVSTSPVADQERAFIRARIAEGMSKDEIKAALVEEYGPDVLAEPSQISAWLVPAAIAAIALLGILALARRWRGGGDPPASQPELDPEDAGRLDAELAAFDR